jgi:hypothetical protein
MCYFIQKNYLHFGVRVFSYFLSRCRQLMILLNEERIKILFLPLVFVCSMIINEAKIKIVFYHLVCVNKNTSFANIEKL